MSVLIIQQFPEVIKMEIEDKAHDKKEEAPMNAKLLRKKG